MGVSKKSNLLDKIFEVKDVVQKATREGYGQGLLEAGRKDERIVALCADLTESTQTIHFAEAFPNRFIEIGVAEQNLAAVAAGLANYGKIPFISSYATFSPGRNWEQIRTTICYNNVPVKIVGSHAGVSVGPDGATHQALEDIAIMRALPNMTVLYPCDANEAQKATLAAAKTKHPVYLRLAREKTAVFTTKQTPFVIGKAEVFFESKGKPDVVLLASGPLVYETIMAAHALEKIGRSVRVINLHTIKPIDERTLIKAARDAGAIVTVEEHQIAGGMGSAVAEILAQHNPVPIEFVGIKNHFGESGTPEQLLKKFGLTEAGIVRAAKQAIARKRSS
ncbi:MAG: transketolase C-terminal domain-containing protein [Patescibacteria group bacterium]